MFGENWANADTENHALVEADSYSHANFWGVYGEAYSLAGAAGVSQSSYSEYGEANARVDNGYFDKDHYSHGEYHHGEMGQAIISADAEAFARGEGYGIGAYGEAVGAGVNQYVSTRASDDAIAQTENHGRIESITKATAIAKGEGGFAGAHSGSVGVNQMVDGYWARGEIVNGFEAYGEYYSAGEYGHGEGEYKYHETDATIASHATAYATGEGHYINAYGEAEAFGTNQNIEGYYARADVENHGTIEGEAYAQARVNEASGYAGADSRAAGVFQYAGAEYHATSYVNNTSHDSITARAEADSEGIWRGHASGEAAGVFQHSRAGYDADATTDNTGLIRGDAIARWHGEGDVAMYPGDYSASTDAAGVRQTVHANDYADAYVNNGAYEYDVYSLKDLGEGHGEGEGYPKPKLIDGDIIGNAYSYAHADGGEGGVAAWANAAGVSQSVGYGPESPYYSHAYTNNHGTIIGEAAAHAIAYSMYGDYEDNVFGEASSVGVGQEVVGYYSASANVTNTSFDSIRSYSNAHATGDENVWADAYAGGVVQEVEGESSSAYASAHVNNTGLIEGEATARLRNVEGSYGEPWEQPNAWSEASGVEQWVYSDYQGNAHVNNGEGGMYVPFHMGEGYGHGEAYGGEPGHIIANAYTYVDSDLPGDWIDNRYASGGANSTGVLQNVQADHYASATVRNHDHIEANAYTRATTAGEGGCHTGTRNGLCRRDRVWINMWQSMATTKATTPAPISITTATIRSSVIQPQWQIQSTLWRLLKLQVPIRKLKTTTTHMSVLTTRAISMVRRGPLPTVPENPMPLHLQWVWDKKQTPGT